MDQRKPSGMAISKDFLWSTVAQLAEELERVDPQSVMAARVRGFLDARDMGLHTTDRHVQSKRHYRQYDDKVAELYLAGKSTYTISAALGISVGAVQGGLRRKDIQTRKSGEARRTSAHSVDQERVERIRTLHEEGKTLSDIARMEGVSRERIRQICLRHGISTKKVLTPEERQAVAEYLAGHSLIEVAERHNVGEWRLKRWIQAAGHSLRRERRKDRAAHTIPNAKRAAELYLAGVSTAAIAADIGVQQPTVYRLLAIAGVQPNRKTERLQVGEQMEAA